MGVQSSEYVTSNDYIDSKFEPLQLSKRIQFLYYMKMMLNKVERIQIYRFPCKP